MALSLLLVLCMAYLRALGQRCSIVSFASVHVSLSFWGNGVAFKGAAIVAHAATLDNIASAVMLQGFISFARGISNIVAAPISSSLLKLRFDPSDGSGFGIGNDKFSSLILFCGLCLVIGGIIEVVLTAIRLHTPPLKVGLT